MSARHGSVHPLSAHLCSGFPERRNTAWPHAGYEGAFSWCGYWKTWDKILGVENGNWVVQGVDFEGRPTGPVRKHSTPIDLRLIYPAPFDPWK